MNGTVEAATSLWRESGHPFETLVDTRAPQGDRDIGGIPIPPEPAVFPGEDGCQIPLVSVYLEFLLVAMALSGTVPVSVVVHGSTRIGPWLPFGISPRR